jgi:Zn-dependent protease with chaperone function
VEGPGLEQGLRFCGGCGCVLTGGSVECGKCSWLPPLAPGYQLDRSAFQWAQDESAMASLRAVSALRTAAEYVSDNIGRKWVEVTFNAVRLGPNQLPAIHRQAVRAAQILGLPHMPALYISGERMWEVFTFGSDKSAFIVVGSALINMFRGADLLFLLAREMGHCRAGHAVWKTVTRLLMGDQGPVKGWSRGLVSLIRPSELVRGTLEIPLMHWARQSEITADRAALLVGGDQTVARRVLFSSSLRSVALYEQIDFAAWMEQEEASEDELTRISEMVSSPTPYLTRRLKVLAAYTASEEFRKYRALIEPHRFDP